MNYLNSSTTSLSIGIAVVLFVGATWLEGEKPEPELPPPEKTPQLIREVRPDSSIREEGEGVSCRDAEARLLATVEDSQSCVIDDDCTILDYGYPLQCMTSIAGDKVSAFRQEYSRYEESCEYRVYYDCPSEPLVRVPVCRNQRCTVELSRNDILKQLTMEHIEQ